MHIDSCENCQMVGCKDHGFYSHYPEECNHFSRKKGCSSHSNNMNTISELKILRNILALQKESEREICDNERKRILNLFGDLIHNESIRPFPTMVDMVYSYRIAQIIVEQNQQGNKSDE